MLGVGFFSSKQGTNIFGDYINGIVDFLRSGRKRPKFSRCIDNLHRIQLSKVDWANEGGRTTNDVPTWAELRDYLADQWINGVPICPSGGSYKINRVGERPTCSIGGSEHSMH